jgi:hypothetical protein
VLFEQVDAALDRVPGAVGDRVECWGPATVGALGSAVGELFDLVRDHRADPVAA